MHEVNLNGLRFNGWDQIQQSDQHSSISKWWGKTYFFYDKKTNKLYAETLSIFGRLFRSIFGYKKQFNKANLWEFLGRVKEVEPNENCPTSKLLRNIVAAKLQHFCEAKDAIITSLTPQMVDALGGIDKVLGFPKLEAWDGRINYDGTIPDPTLAILTAPVMRGQHKGKPYLLFCYLMSSEHDGEMRINGDILVRENNGWSRRYPLLSQLNCGIHNAVPEGSLGETFMLDKIRRLMNYEPVGLQKWFPINERRNVNNAYLEGEDLVAYMALDTSFYERRPEGRPTDLFLYDPSLSRNDNNALYLTKFPNA